MYCNCNSYNITTEMSSRRKENHRTGSISSICSISSTTGKWLGGLCVTKNRTVTWVIWARRMASTKRQEATRRGSCVASNLECTVDNGRCLLEATCLSRSHRAVLTQASTYTRTTHRVVQRCAVVWRPVCDVMSHTCPNMPSRNITGKLCIKTRSMSSSSTPLCCAGVGCDSYIAT